MSALAWLLVRIFFYPWFSYSLGFISKGLDSVKLAIKSRVEAYCCWIFGYLLRLDGTLGGVIKNGKLEQFFFSTCLY